MYVPLITIILDSLWSQVNISEVMFDLDGTDSPHEFVEIYNLYFKQISETSVVGKNT